MEKITITTSKNQYHYVLDGIDNDDNLEQLFSEFIQYYLNKKTIQKKSAGAFDEFFGTLKSDKSISLEEMDKAIAMRGGQ